MTEFTFNHQEAVKFLLEHANIEWMKNRNQVMCEASLAGLKDFAERGTNVEIVVDGGVASIEQCPEYCNVEIQDLDVDNNFQQGDAWSVDLDNHGDHFNLEMAARDPNGVDCVEVWFHLARGGMGPFGECLMSILTQLQVELEGSLADAAFDFAVELVKKAPDAFAAMQALGGTCEEWFESPESMQEALAECEKSCGM